MPKLRKGESRDAYVSRAIPILMAEGLSHNAAIGKAEGMYSYYSKHKGKYSSKKKSSSKKK
jgi:hypothetical protein